MRIYCKPCSSRRESAPSGKNGADSRPLLRLWKDSVNKRIIPAGGSGFLGGVLGETFHRAEMGGRRVDPASEAACGQCSGGGVGWRDGWRLGAGTGGGGSRRESVRQVGGLSLHGEEPEVADRIAHVADARRRAGHRQLQVAAAHMAELQFSDAYKHTFDTPMDENGAVGATHEAKDEFSIEIINQWERALNEATTPRTRKVAMRTTMVLGRSRNSVVPVLRRLTRLGLGGAQGPGGRFFSGVPRGFFSSGGGGVVRPGR